MTEIFKRPIPGTIYNYAQLAGLELRDTPCLNLQIQGHLVPIQHPFEMSDAELARVMAPSRWKYTHTTSEWIPVFYCDNPADTADCVDAALVVRYDRVECFVTPKGGMWPAEQLYPDEGTWPLGVTALELLVGDIVLPFYPWTSLKDDDGTGDDDDDFDDDNDFDADDF